MSIEDSIGDLKKDLCHPNGPCISTNQSYPFAILHYRPEDEFRARELVGSLVDELRLQGWNIRNIDLFALFLDFIKKEEDGDLYEGLVCEEHTQYGAAKNGYRAPLHTLKNSLAPYFTQASAYPKMVLDEIASLQNSADTKRSAIFLSRIGALYPFYRTSSLLRFLDKGVRTPCIVLYPGTRVEQHYLSFMGVMDADRDYRPRIY
jgi:hypothetical protein